MAKFCIAYKSDRHYYTANVHITLHKPKLSSIPKQYVSAIFHHVSSCEEAGEVIDGMETLLHYFCEKEEGKFNSSMLDNSISKSKKLTKISEIYGKLAELGVEINKKSLAFFFAIVKRGHLKRIDDIMHAMQERLNKMRGSITVTFTSSKLLSEKHKADLIHLAEEKLGSKNINSKFCIDPDIISGLIVDVGSSRMDLSLQSKLQRLNMISL